MSESNERPDVATMIDELRFIPGSIEIYSMGCSDQHTLVCRPLHGSPDAYLGRTLADALWKAVRANRERGFSGIEELFPAPPPPPASHPKEGSAV